ncbi:MAG: ferric reductase-like transmembrane domain-containing protein [Actinobacteria bacterium]|nr:ferric reductase-like transmembrane domain-containing protein [Actinomycetota bacterium]
MIANTLFSAKALWYLTRGTGIVSLLLLTASVALGVLTTARGRSHRWPRFALGGLHKHLTLLAVAFVVIHVLTTILDGYAPVRIVDALVPFVSRYRPVWLGLGTVAFDLLIALVITSLLRARLGHRLWRRVHWLAYACWPVALVHALGTGSDARSGFMLIVGVGAVVLVLAAVLARVWFVEDGAAPTRVATAVAALVCPLAIGLWFESGPGKTGWARRAGTPQRLLAHRVTPVSATVRKTTTVSLPRTRFAARVRGRIRESNDLNGLLHVVISGRLAGGPGGVTRIDLRGQPVSGGVTMSASGVSYVPAGTRTVYTGSVTTLAGKEVVASVSSGAGGRLQLVFRLAIDSRAGTVAGTVDGAPVSG